MVNSNTPLDDQTPYTKCGYRCRAQTANVPPYPDPESITRELDELYDSLTAVISVEISAKLCSTVRYCRFSNDEFLRKRATFMKYSSLFFLRHKMGA